MFDQDESENAMTPELAAIEHQLVGLGVAPLLVDRDQLMFDAGRAAERGEHERALIVARRGAGAMRWVWPAAVASLTAACVVLSAMLIWPDDNSQLASHLSKPEMTPPNIIAAPMRDLPQDAPKLAAASRSELLPVRPTGGYLEKRYVALTLGVNELQADDDAADGSQRNRKPATARDLLRDLMPQNAPSTDSHS
jgi:hypothetical protein